VPPLPTINVDVIMALFSTLAVALASGWGLTKALHFLKFH